MTTYQSHNANPVDRLLADSPHAERLHNGDGADVELWFGNRLWPGDASSTVALLGAVGTAPIAATVRCCVPPDADTAHNAFCPAYGYPTPPPAPPTDEATLTSWAAAGLASTFVEGATGQTDDRIRDLTAHAAGAAIAQWAAGADKRTVTTPDGLIWCRGFYMFDDGGCEHPRDARFDLQMEDAGGVFAQLVVWVGLHAGCENPREGLR